MDTDILKELAPCIIGLFVPIFFIFARNFTWPAQLKFTGSLAAALVIGVATSAIVGELALDFPDNIISVLIDTSLVFTGYHVAYQYLWRPTLEAWLVRRSVPVEAKQP